MKSPRKSPSTSGPAGAPKSEPPESAAQPRKRVLIVDDHPFMRDGLAHLINKQPDLVVCAEAGNPQEAFRILGQAKPDLVLTDMTMPGRSGLEFIKDLQAAEANLRILVISMHDELVYAERALRAGARGYIMKEAGGENLLTAIRQILNGDVYVSPRMSARILDALSGRKKAASSSPVETLSDREFEIFQLIGHGKNTKDIAAQLGLSPKTVDVHRSNIKEKLKLEDLPSLIREAVRWVETK